MKAPIHRIVIRLETWGSRTDVIIVPPLLGETIDRDFTTADEARAYAADLSTRTGLPVLDDTSASVTIGGGL